MVRWWRVFSLPHCSISRLSSLPPSAGIYYVTAFGLIFYIGKAKNLRQRWQRHHRRAQVQLLSPFGRLHYRLLPLADLGAAEKLAIAHHRPYWNNQRVPGFWGLWRLYWAVWGRLGIYGLLGVAVVGVGLWRLGHP
ncbi:MAG: GIY-YIG nuclease family protein [Oscillatoriales cyanobacterium SM2_2_1]|nr:GIY-YIG nuclease family protein [Oscillatoriales cyanobacterium SM2_2_1]